VPLSPHPSATKKKKKWIGVKCLKVIVGNGAINTKRGRGELMGLNFYDASHISKNEAIKVKRLKFEKLG
jgi:hypothetical protein